MTCSYNKVILVGNLTRDPELRELDSSKCVCNFDIAVNNPRNEKEVLFQRIECWGGLARTVSNHMSKGRSVLVEGRLRNDNWIDKETEKKRTITVVVADEVRFNDSKRIEPSSSTPEEVVAGANAEVSSF